MIVRSIGRKGKRAAALLLAGVLTAAMLPGNIRAEENYSAGDEQQTDAESEITGVVPADDSAAEEVYSLDAAGTETLENGADAQGNAEDESAQSDTARDSAGEDLNGQSSGQSGKDAVQEEEAAQEEGEAQKGESAAEGDPVRPENPVQPEDPPTGTEGQQIWQMTDPATGISAEADISVIPQGTIMWVTPLESGQNYELLKMLLSMTADQFKIYDIRFFDMTGSAVQPGGSVKISVPIPDGYALDRLAVYHISMEGQRTELAFTAENGSAVFETDQFSLFAIAEKKQDSGAQTDLPSSLAPTEKIPRLELDKTAAGTSGSASGAGYAKNTASPATGDIQESMRWTVLAVLAGAAATVSARRRRLQAEAVAEQKSRNSGAKKA